MYLASHRQWGHLETSPPFTVACEGREAWFLHRPHRESNPGLLRGSPLHYRCATPDPLFFWRHYLRRVTGIFDTLWIIVMRCSMQHRCFNKHNGQVERQLSSKRATRSCKVSSSMNLFLYRRKCYRVEIVSLNKFIYFVSQLIVLMAQSHERIFRRITRRFCSFDDFLVFQVRRLHTESVEM